MYPKYFTIQCTSFHNKNGNVFLKPSLPPDFRAYFEGGKQQGFYSKYFHVTSIFHIPHSFHKTF